MRVHVWARRASLHRSMSELGICSSQGTKRIFYINTDSPSTTHPSYSFHLCTFLSLCLVSATDTRWCLYIRNVAQRILPISKALLRYRYKIHMADVRAAPGIAITLWGFRYEVCTSCQHKALVWVRKDEFGRLLTNKRANRIETRNSLLQCPV